MVFHRVTVIYVFTLIIQIEGYEAEFTKDQTSSRPNTLFDDADDIQRQLNNEAHDKIMLGKLKTVWVLHLPTEHPHGTIKPGPRYSRNWNIFRKTKKTTKSLSVDKIKEKYWTYKEQNKWSNHYPDCAGRSQSPVDLPAVGLVKTKGGRELTFINYDIVPQSLKLNNDGKRLVLYGEWECDRQPVIYGGAAHSRRYLFHSITLHWPSEHRIGGLQYPLESQVIHISAEYRTLQEAIDAASRDSQAILGVVNLFKFDNHTQQGLEELLQVADISQGFNSCVSSLPLAYFNPPMNQYACYQGSLTTPPCTENVLWLIRARALPVTRKAMEVVNNLFGEGETRESFIRQPQPLNDRRVYLFN